MVAGGWPKLDLTNPNESSGGPVVPVAIDVAEGAPNEAGRLSAPPNPKGGGPSGSCCNGLTS